MKRILIALGILCFLAVGAAAGVYVWEKRQSRDVRLSTVSSLP